MLNVPRLQVPVVTLLYVELADHCISVLELPGAPNSRQRPMASKIATSPRKTPGSRPACSDHGSGVRRSGE